MNNESTKKPVALVLSSGGARGLAHIGAIEVLEKSGYKIHSVAGSSMGALIGGLYAMGRLKDYKNWITKLKRKDVFSLMDFTISGSGLVKAERIFEKMREFIPDMPIGEMPIPFTAVATDVINEKEVIFESGSFYEAVRASIAIPAVITPVKKNNSVLVDGGVMNPLPFQYVKRIKGDMLVMVNLYGRENKKISSGESEIVKKIDTTPEAGILDRFHNSENYQTIRNWIADFISAGDHANKGYISLLNTVSRLMIIRLAEQEAQLANPGLLITIPQNSAGAWDFHKAKDLIELGRRAATEALKG
jgi:NTE family protein